MMWLLLIFGLYVINAEAFSAWVKSLWHNK